VVGTGYVGARAEVDVESWESLAVAYHVVAYHVVGVFDASSGSAAVAFLRRRGD